MRTIILLAICLLITAPVMAAGPPTSTFERQLVALTKGPIVSTLDIPASQDPQSAIPNPKSLEELTESYGLALFDQDSIQVIGPAQRLDFTDLLSGKATSEMSNPLDLLLSLNDSQLSALGSFQGLPAESLSPEQLAYLSAVLPDSRGARLIGRFQVSDVLVRIPNGGNLSIDGTPDSPGRPSTDTESTVRGIPGVYMVANSLKKSDLDYSLPALQAPITINGQTNLRDLVDTIVRETGVNLHTGPGSDGVYVYILASKVPAGSLLKAVSLATTGAWRQLGDAFIFAPDLAGIGQIDGLAGQMGVQMLGNWALSENRVSNLFRNTDLFSMLPFGDGTRFYPTPYQIRAMLSMGQPFLTWGMMTDDQRAIIEQRVFENQPERLADADRSGWTAEFTVTMQMAADIPDGTRVILPIGESGLIGMVQASSEGFTVFPPQTTDDTSRLLSQNAYMGYHLSINKPLRGYVCKPSRLEMPVWLIGSLVRNGFNALYLRVFSDGCTAFPSKQFPGMSGIDPDYLRQTIALAHAKGIKVFGVVDVLRWSDGKPGSWVSKYPALLDYDVLGRTRSEFMQVANEQSDALMPEAANGDMFQLSDFGEGFTGDAVSPFQPEVGKRLQSMLPELAAYDLDGLCLDYTTMRHTVLGWPFDAFYAAGRPGHNPAARMEFFHLYGVDSIDIPPSGSDLSGLPLQPIVQACVGLQTAWTEFYRKGCDDLLESLAKKWKTLNPPDPQSAIPNPKSNLWVLMTFKAGRDSHDWPRFTGLVDGVLISGIDFPGTAGHYYGLPSMPILRASDQIGTLRFAGYLASGLGYDSSSFPSEFVRDSPWDAKGVVIDFTTAGKVKNDYLRIIDPPK